MALSPTTWFGALAAAATAIAAVPGMPEGVKHAAAAAAAVALALLGFFAADAKPTPTIPKAAKIIAVAFAGITLLAGCTLSHFALAAANPTFGSLSIDVGHGAVGNVAVQQPVTTNTAALAQAALGSIINANSNTPTTKVQSP
ncbi:MAG TPA: hypothetical protein VMQ76_05360 [Terracidiphilus sp.]|jgi:hypothetical protein|nr:hypothetical protein [Terracidiphilus sp.]